MGQNFSLELKELAEKGQLKSFIRAKDLIPPFVEYRGKQVISFSSWDYLSIRSHKRIREVLHAEVENTSISIPSPRLISGNRHGHMIAEERLSKFLHREASLLFSSRNQGAYTLFASLLTEQDVVFIEETSQAPVADAAFLVGAATQYFSFSGESSLKKLSDSLEKVKVGRPYVFCETFSPSTGQLSPLDDLLPIVAKSKAHLVLDDTFALGAIGMRGAGSIDLAPALKSQSLATIGTFGFGLPGFGGFIAGSKDLIGYLLNRSKTFLVEPPIPEYLTACAEPSIDIVESMISQRTSLIEVSEQLSANLKLSGFSVLPVHGPLVCVSFEKPSLADEFCEFLFTKGFLVERVPRGTLLNQRSVVRFVINSSHSSEHISALCGALVESSKIR